MKEPPRRAVLWMEFEKCLTGNAGDRHTFELIFCEIILMEIELEIRRAQRSDSGLVFWIVLKM